MRKILTLLTVFMLGIFTAHAQSRTITGRVTDNQGQPIDGASVVVKGTSRGTTSNATGAFTITANTGETLTFSALNYGSIDIAIKNQSSVNATLSGNIGNLSEVVVTTALGVQRQARSLGYSTTKISGDNISEAKVTNIANGLAAKVSGLQINLVNNGVKPDVRITLRGNRSILGNNQALLVVDDVQLPISYLNSINPNDVESSTILKGASASALYGSAASNGVIIITTKKGKTGKPQVKLSSTETWESIAYTPKFNNEFGQYGGEFPATSYAGTVVFPNEPYLTYVPYENQNYGPRFNGQRVPLGAPIRIYNADGTYTIKQDSAIYSAKPNAKKDFFNTGLSAINDISYSAGDDKSKFFLSFEDVNTTGVVPKDKNHRNTIRLNGSRTSGIFRADYNVGYTLTHTNTTPGSGVPFTYGSSGLAGGYAGGGSYFQNRPLYWTIINSPADVDLRNYKNWQTNPFATPDGYFNAYYGNPWWQIDQTRLDEKSSDLIANIALDLKPAKWVDLLYRAGIGRNDYSNKYTQAGYTFAPWAIADTLGSGNIPSSTKAVSPSEGDALSYNQRLTSDFLASFHAVVKDFDFRFIAGSQLIDNRLRLINASASTLVIPNFYNISNGLGVPVVGEFLQNSRVLGVFGDLTAGYKNFLFVHGSLRNDWTSLLSKANRSYLYPSIDGSFVFTDAISGLKNNNILSFGKLTASWSKTAQVSINPYSLQNVFNSGAGFPYGNVAGYTVSPSFANPDIKPEFSTDEEIGLELQFLRNRLGLKAAAYHTTTNNQTIPIGISPTTGFTQAYVNSGVMTNKGIELDVRATVLQTQDFHWEVTANYSYNKNNVESLGYGLTNVFVGGNSFAQIGSPYPIIKTSDWQRDPQGHIVVDPNTGNPILDPNQKSFGTTNPPTKIGLTTSVSYKGFTLNAVADGRFGAVIYNSIGSDLDFTGVSYYSTSSGRQPFVVPNSVINTGNGKYVANTNISTQYGNNEFWANVWNTAGSNYVTSADFWKLREVSLTYTFPKNIIQHLKVVNDVSLSVIGRNLVTIRAKDNIWSDPEFSNTIGNGIGTTDINQLPPTKFYGVNLSIVF